MSAASSPAPLRPRLKPTALCPGDTIAIVAPAGPAPLQSLENGRVALEREGFRVVFGDHVLQRRGYLAGTAVDRAADLMAAFLDPSVGGIICARGGYGSMQVLPLLDYGAIRANPKVLVGYSDITALHGALARRAGLVTFHGQMASFGEPPSEYTWQALMSAITCPEPLGELVNPMDQGLRITTLVPGQAAGCLTGGNLSLLSATIGTPYEVETDGTLLVLEDVGEAPYRMDRMLTHLLLAGKFDGVRGIIFGESVGCEDLIEVLKDLLVPLGVPLFYGLACGHGQHRVTLPFGVEATMDADSGTVTVVEAALTAPGRSRGPCRPIR